MLLPSNRRPNAQDKDVMHAWVDFRTMRHAFNRVASLPRSEYGKLDISKMEHLIGSLRQWSEPELRPEHAMGPPEWLKDERGGIPRMQRYNWMRLRGACLRNERLGSLFMPFEVKMAHMATHLEGQMVAKTAIDAETSEWKAVGELLDFVVEILAEDKDRLEMELRPKNCHC